MSGSFYTDYHTSNKPNTLWRTLSPIWHLFSERVRHGRNNEKSEHSFLQWTLFRPSKTAYIFSKLDRKRIWLIRDTSKRIPMSISQEKLQGEHLESLPDIARFRIQGNTSNPIHSLACHVSFTMNRFAQGVWNFQTLNVFFLEEKIKHNKLKRPRKKTKQTEKWCQCDIFPSWKCNKNWNLFEYIVVCIASKTKQHKWRFVHFDWCTRNAQCLTYHYLMSGMIVICLYFIQVNQLENVGTSATRTRVSIIHHKMFLISVDGRNHLILSCLVLFFRSIFI